MVFGAVGISYKQADWVIVTTVDRIDISFNSCVSALFCRASFHLVIAFEGQYFAKFRVANDF